MAKRARKRRKLCLGTVRVSFLSVVQHDDPEEFEKQVRRAAEIIELATKMLESPTFREMAKLEGKKPCGCSGS